LICPARVIDFISERTSKEGITFQELAEKMGEKNSAGYYVLRLAGNECWLMTREGDSRKLEAPDVLAINPDVPLPKGKYQIPSPPQRVGLVGTGTGSAGAMKDADNSQITSSAPGREPLQTSRN
jgi:hypothetical protein